MKILQIIPFDTCKGGTQYSTLRIINHVNNYPDIEFVLLTFCPVEEIGNITGSVKIYREYSHLFTKNHIRINTIPLYIKIVKKIIKTEHIDIIHYNLHSLLFVDLLFNRCRIPFVWTDRSIYSKYRLYSKLILRLILKRTKSILITTTKYNLKLWKKIGVNGHYIPNTVNMDNFDNINSHDMQSTINIVQIGRIDKDKRYEMGIEIIEKLRRDYNMNAKLFIYGAQESYSENRIYRQYLDTLIESRGMKGQIIFKGFIQPLHLKRVLTEYTLHLITSAEESFGRTIIESFIAHLPVISYSNIGASEIIKNNQNGILINNDDIDIFCEGIIKIHEDAKFRNQIIDNATKTVEKNYTIDKLDKYYNIYKEIIYSNK